MDPSGFNLNALGNVIRAKDEWKNGKKRPWSLRGALVVLVIFGAAFGWLFYPKNNWNVLSKVPLSQVRQLKSTMQQANFAIQFPTQLPFVPTSVHSQLSSHGQFRTIQISFSNGQDVIEERVTNDYAGLAIPHFQNRKTMTLPGHIPAITGMSANYPQLYWTSLRFSYGLGVEKWQTGNPPTENQLFQIYQTMKTDAS